MQSKVVPFPTHELSNQPGSSQAESADQGDISNLITPQFQRSATLIWNAPTARDVEKWITQNSSRPEAFSVVHYKGDLEGQPKSQFVIVVHPFERGSSDSFNNMINSLSRHEDQVDFYAKSRAISWENEREKNAGSLFSNLLGFVDVQLDALSEKLSGAMGVIIGPRLSEAQAMLERLPMLTEVLCAEVDPARCIDLVYGLENNPQLLERVIISCCDVTRLNIAPGSCYVIGGVNVAVQELGDSNQMLAAISSYLAKDGVFVGTAELDTMQASALGVLATMKFNNGRLNANENGIIPVCFGVRTGAHQGLSAQEIIMLNAQAA